MQYVNCVCYWCIADWNCGELSRNELHVLCYKLVRQQSHPAPPMDPGPKVGSIVALALQGYLN